MRIVRRHAVTQELQIGPMIDLIFLLLIFFMVQPQTRPEGELGLELPGVVSPAEPVALPDEQRLVIRADGQILLNELPVGAPGDRDLAALRAILRRFRQACDADRVPARVTVLADDQAVHQRIADALDACARAGITGVSLGSGDDGNDAGF